MGVRTVIGYHVDDDLEAHGVGTVREGREVLEGTEVVGDGGVVGDVVAAVGQRRRIAGRDPDRVRPEVPDVVQVPGDARQIPGPVAVGVGERAGVYLVTDGVAPPDHAVRLRSPTVSTCCVCPLTVALVAASATATALAPARASATGVPPVPAHRTRSAMAARTLSA